MKHHTNHIFYLTACCVTLCAGVLLHAKPVDLQKSQSQRIVIPGKFKKQNHYLVRHFPIENTGGSSFRLTYQVDIEIYGHYASVTAGLSHSTFSRRTFVEWSKGDNHKQTATIAAELLPQLRHTHKKFSLPHEMQSYRFCIEYNAANRSVRWSLLSKDKEILQQSPWVKIKEDLSFDRFSVWAKTPQKTENYPSYVEVTKDGVQTLSQVGKGRGYQQKCLISDIDYEILERNADFQTAPIK